MVKKKVSKKKFLKRKSSGAIGRHSSSEDGSMSKKDFEAFKFGVQRLKELGAELKSLDARGFPKEVQAIRSKLKDVSEIPNIESAIKSLRAKIHGKYKPKRKKKNPIKEIHKDIEDVKEDLQRFRKSRKESFEDIKEEIKKLGKKKKSYVPLDSGVDVLVDTNFNDFLVSMKKALSERIANREEQMDSVLKNDLAKREEKYNKKHNSLLRDFQAHKNKLDEQLKRKISELGRKEKNTEQLYEKKYEQKVGTELHKEVMHNFNKMLKDKLDREKVELGKVYKTQLRQHAADELAKRQLKLEGKAKKELTEKMSRMDSKFKKRILEEGRREMASKAELDRQKNELVDSKRNFVVKKEEEMKRIRDRLIAEEHRQLKIDLAKKEAVLRKQLGTEYELKLKKQVQDNEQELKKRKMDLELEMQKKIKQLLN